MGPKNSATNSKSSHSKYLASFSLALLTVQNATQTLVMRYVRTRPGDMFFSTTAVCVSEFIKCITCLCIILFRHSFNIKNWLSHLKVNMFSDPMDTLKISLPGFLYVLQNNLLYVAASNLEAANYQVAYQLKLLTTALFSVVMLKKCLSWVQWLSLVILTIGVAMVQFPSDSSNTPRANENRLVGFSAVVAACFLSGFSGVYFEKILKNTPQSVYVRNVQLGSLGTVLGLVVCWWKDGDDVMQKGFFFGYNIMVWVIIFLLALGGLIVAAVVKYADNILKGFATSGSIVIACLVSVFLFNFQITAIFSLGSFMVIISIYLYSKYIYKVSDVKVLPN